MMSYENLIILAMLLVISQMKVTASPAQIKCIPDGQFPPGTVYKETDLAHLVGKKLPRAQLSRRQIHVLRRVT